jgi:signal transduction histidine kinase/DNA-binding response OmpR family regulator
MNEGQTPSEHPKIEQVLQRDEGLFRRILEISPDGILVLDGEGTVIYANPSAHVLLNQSGLEGELFGYPIVAGESVEVDVPRRDGTIFVVEMRLIEVNEHVQSEAAYLVVLHDVTMRKQAEMEISFARDAAEAVTRAKSAFLANMSHEIRTPMNAVIGMTNLLLGTYLSSEQQDYVQTIRISGDTLLTLIDDILDFSKIEAGRLELFNQPFSLCNCIEEALELLAPRADEQGITLTYMIDTNIPCEVRGDITRVRQILLNLLSNAVKFTDQGEVVVSIERGENRMEHNAPLSPDSVSTLHSQFPIHISVRDTGIGIPANKIKNLFQSFSQIDTSRKRKHNGAGLGLIISKRLAELMGGTIWVESEEGNGSTFHVTLLLESVPGEVHPSRNSDQPLLRGKHILVVDDNQTNRQIVAGTLARWGVVPTTAASASEALAWLEHAMPLDLVILDDVLPDMDGLSLAREIRLKQTRRGLPIMLWCPIISQGEMIRKSKSHTPPPLNITAFLIKPFRPIMFYNTLTNFFLGKPLERQLRGKWEKIDRNMGQRSPLRLLLVEDNMFNQKVALRLLDRIGYQADVAANGWEALQVLERQRYDVVLMDIQMPVMDGIETTRAIRARFAPPYQPWVIAMTAYAQEENREWLLHAGLDDYIRKPVDLEYLVQALKRAKQKTDSHQQE